MFCFFFFQAEDGIRDLTVTGVQTCALPISMDAANMLKPALVRGDIRVIGATTGGEYDKWIRGDPALERRLPPGAGAERGPGPARGGARPGRAAPHRAPPRARTAPSPQARPRPPS